MLCRADAFVLSGEVARRFAVDDLVGETGEGSTPAGQRTDGVENSEGIVVKARDSGDSPIGLDSGERKITASSPFRLSGLPHDWHQSKTIPRDRLAILLPDVRLFCDRVVGRLMARHQPRKWALSNADLLTCHANNQFTSGNPAYSIRAYSSRLTLAHGSSPHTLWVPSPRSRRCM